MARDQMREEEMSDQPPDGEPAATRALALLAAASMMGAMCVGVWLRWTLAGALTLSLPFDHLRHAHSHLGYFGLLFPLAWMGWGAAGARVPGRAALGLYALVCALACLGFVRSGYGPLAIAGSTAVAAIWLWSALALRGRMRRLYDPLGAAPLGLIASLACVPPIALNLRSDPALAHGFVSTFLAGLLFVVILPSTLAGRRLAAGPWPLLLAAGALGALALGAAPHPVTRLGLLLYAALIVAPARSAALPLHLRAVWAAVALGLGAMAFEIIPNTRPVALGAIHFLILGPVLCSLAPLWLKRQPPGWAWWCGHALWGTMAAALVAQAFTSSGWTWTLAAAGGSGALLWWCAALLSQAQARC